MSPEIVLGVLTAGVGVFGSGFAWVMRKRRSQSVRSMVARLREPTTRAAALDLLHGRVRFANGTGDIFKTEEALRDALEPVILAGLWEDVIELAKAGVMNHTPEFSRWLHGVVGLAYLYEQNYPRSQSELEQVKQPDDWVTSVDTLRLALSGEARQAMEALDGLASSRSPAVRYQCRLARMHALAALGQEDSAEEMLREVMREQPEIIEAVVELEGPASPIARKMQRGGASPFRS